MSQTIPMTRREIEVVQLICAGRRNREIAAHLFISVATVKTHLHHIYKKLSVRGRIELSAYGRRNGLA